MEPFLAYQAARQQQATQQARLGLARRHYHAQQREANRQWPYPSQQGQREAYCQAARQAVRRCLTQTEQAQARTLAAALAVPDKTLMANEYY